MSDTTMTTKLRQAEAAIRAMAEELEIPTDTAHDAVQIGIYDGRFLLTTTQLSGYKFTSGATLEEAFLKAMGEEMPF
jgi:hypothetical protein